LSTLPEYEGVMRQTIASGIGTKKLARLPGSDLTPEGAAYHFGHAFWYILPVDIREPTACLVKMTVSVLL
jgi:hypothetical protein